MALPVASPNLETIFTTLTVTDVLAFVTNQRGEDLTLDFKLVPATFDRDERKILAIAISGFANASGGLVVWGVDARRGADDVDCAQQTRPLADATLFMSRLTEFAGGATSPPVPGVRHRLVEGVGGPFAVTYVPDSDGGPYMAKHGEDRYYQRSSDRFLKMEHFAVADMFGRRRRPRLVLALNREPNGSLMIQLANEGRGVAKSPYVAIRLPRSFRPSHYGFDGNGRFGLPFIGHASDWCSYGGESNKVIHSGQVVQVSRIDPTAVTASGQAVVPGPQTFGYELAAEDQPLERGELIVAY